MRVPKKTTTAGQTKQVLPRASSDTFRVVHGDRTNTVISDKGDVVEESCTEVCEDVDRLLLKSICLYEIFHARSIKPANHFKGVQDHGSKRYTWHLLKSTEESLGMPPGPRHNLEQRLQSIEDSRDLQQWLEDEQFNPNESNFSVWGYLVVLEDYEKHESNFLHWPLKKLDSYALIFAARDFGRLGYTFPSNIGLDKVSSFLNALICLHRGSPTQDAARSLKLTTNLKSCDSWLQVESGTSLRKYRELGRGHCLLEVPNDFSFSSFVRQLQDFPQTTTSVANWPEHKVGDAAIRYMIKCYNDLGYQASQKDILKDDPIRVLSNIYSMSAQKRVAHGRYDEPKTPPPSECGGRIKETPHMEQSNTGPPSEERRVQRADNSTLCKYGHPRVATCANMTSIGLVSWRKRIDALHCENTDLAALLRACHLLFRVNEDKARCDRRRAEPCINCIWKACMKKHPQHRAEWAISETELLLSLNHLPDQTLYHRMTACEKRLNIQNFSLRPSSPGGRALFNSTKQPIQILQIVDDFRLQEKDKSDVDRDSQAQTIYAVACLSNLNCSSPEELNYNSPKALPPQLVEVFNQIMLVLDHRNSYTTANTAYKPSNC
ncbi:uncharacterized protein FTOL_12438 [Fusarium torulosum]|uniref:Uncharacterized protein n=1 Tax=Fusarium torulosum TaxID=33205 RepID=A0AAE8MKK4_9HYPO|nr:uncharacterized protein FTOL_12438 [Fusarium torulosum]